MKMLKVLIGNKNNTENVMDLKKLNGALKEMKSSLGEDKAYYQSQLNGLGKAAWPDVTIVVSNDGKKTKFLTLTPELVKELGAWVKKQGIKAESEMPGALGESKGKDFYNLINDFAKQWSAMRAEIEKSDPEVGKKLFNLGKSIRSGLADAARLVRKL